MSCLACQVLPSDVLRLCPKVGTLACAAACKIRVSSVLLVCMWGAVSRCLVLFKFKDIMAFSEAADTVEVSITASTAQGGILIADAAPGELLFLGVKPGRQGLNLQGLERNGGSKVLDGVWVAGCYKSSS